MTGYKYKFSVFVSKTQLQKRRFVIKIRKPLDFRHKKYKDRCEEHRSLYFSIFMLLFVS